MGDLFDAVEQISRERLHAAGWVCVPMPGGDLWRLPPDAAMLTFAEALKQQDRREGAA